MTHFPRRAAALAALLIAAGCAGTPTQYYSLADAAAPPAGARAGAPSMFIEFAPIAMAERFARPQMVVRQAGASDGPAVDILEDSRWASSFEDELRDALGSGVAARLGAVDSTKAGRPRGQPATRIAVQLQRFDAIAGRRVDAAFSWTVRRGDDAASTACQIALLEPVGEGIDAVAAGARRATSKLADAIARSVTATTCPA
jgi:uncharacterized protein